MHSGKAQAGRGLGWHRAGTRICYYSNTIRRGRSGKTYFTLTFTLTTEYDNDLVHVAHCYPYTYTDLQRYIRVRAGERGGRSGIGTWGCWISAPPPSPRNPTSSQWPNARAGLGLPLHNVASASPLSCVSMYYLLHLSRILSRGIRGEADL